LRVDAIVNAANSSLLGGTLHGCETGDAKITLGYRLPARHVIHAVGPVWHGGSQREDQALASCYARAIELCQTHGLASVAFPAISTGIYRFPADRAAGIAVASTVDALATAPAVSRVVFCCFSDESAALHAQAMAGFGSPCT
jgi:O-acetyl-ADP-ribose deacetylase (regulator of RNase III)